MARLLHGRHQAKAEPALTQRTFQLACWRFSCTIRAISRNAVIPQGTGAKYTVTMSAAAPSLPPNCSPKKGFSAEDIQAVQNMIRCTGVNTTPRTIPFHSEQEKIAGFALATADLLGQMAADDYVEELPTLYDEFAEAARFTKDKSHFVASFKSASDLIEKTPTFWEKFVRPKLEREFLGLYRFLSNPFPDGSNYYLERIAANMERLKEGQSHLVGA